ncbi:uncharacterized protein LOC131579925 [Poecile atricapillus]|uniref:uncharacterized protein LOC131579925 n=1 Tax=Poecile atricapillus TaxID=48891 RepID=UPI002739FBE3|nr:uncharacterized protein LOC131579925 [Poecile atricapillus]
MHKEKLCNLWRLQKQYEHQSTFPRHGHVSLGIGSSTFILSECWVLLLFWGLVLFWENGFHKGGTEGHQTMTEIPERLLWSKVHFFLFFLTGRKSPIHNGQPVLPRHDSGKTSCGITYQTRLSCSQFYQKPSENDESSPKVERTISQRGYMRCSKEFHKFEDVWLGWELTPTDSDHSSSQKCMKTWKEPLRDRVEVMGMPAHLSSAPRISSWSLGPRYPFSRMFCMSSWKCEQ